MYVYHVTKIDKEFMWRCTKFDFGKSQPGNKLITVATAPDARGKIKEYYYEAFVRGERLIIIGKAGGGIESSMCYVFPFIRHAFRDVDSGVLFHQTYDSDHSISPAIISTDPLFSISDQKKMGQSKFSELDVAWHEHLKNDPHILPRMFKIIRKHGQTKNNLSETIIKKEVEEV